MRPAFNAGLHTEHLSVQVFNWLTGSWGVPRRQKSSSMHERRSHPGRHFLFWTTICTVHTRIHLSNADLWDDPAHQYIRAHKSISNGLPGQHRVLLSASGARRSHLELAARCKSCFFNTVSCLVVTALESAQAMCGWPFVMGLQSMSASSAELTLKNTAKSLQKRCSVIVTLLLPPLSLSAL